MIKPESPERQKEVSDAFLAVLAIVQPLTREERKRVLLATCAMLGVKPDGAR